jgi:hypothetical protein
MWEWGEIATFLGAQASPARPSDEDSVEAKTLGWLEVAA